MDTSIFLVLVSQSLDILRRPQNLKKIFHLKYEVIEVFHILSGRFFFKFCGLLRIFELYVTKLGLSNDHLPTFSCLRSYWMTPNQAYQWSRVGCSFSADTYIFRHGAGSAKNGCSIVEERLLSAIKEDGVEAKKRPELRRHFYWEKLKLSAVSHFHWTPPQPAWLLFWYSQWV